MMHDTCLMRGSTSVTLIVPWLHMRRYLATVLPANPPPRTITRWGTAAEPLGIRDMAAAAGIICKIVRLLNGIVLFLLAT